MLEASVVVPTRNRARVLGQCLTSLVEQSAKPDRFEILIVDNASAADTRALVTRFIDTYRDHSIRYIQERIPGLLSGRHRGAKEAGADILCFVDDDIIADADWLQCILDGFEATDVHLMGGPSSPRFEQPPPTWVEHFMTSVPQGRVLDSLSLIDLGPSACEIAAYFVWGLNFNIRTHTLREMGGFHPDGVPLQLVRFRGDGEGGLSNKIIEKGYKTLYHPGARVNHVIGPDRLTSDYFRRRRFLQGISDSYSEIRRAGSADDVQLRPRGEVPEHSKKDAEAFVRTLRCELENAHADGFNFHVMETKADPELLAWVLRPSYLQCYEYGPLKATERNTLPLYFLDRGEP